MIPTKPPPNLRDPKEWSEKFIDFLNCCLVKDPEQRSSANQLLEHPFVQSVQPVSILQEMIDDALKLHAERATQRKNRSAENQVQNFEIFIFLNFFQTQKNSFDY